MSPKPSCAHDIPRPDAPDSSDFKTHFLDCVHLLRMPEKPPHSKLPPMPESIPEGVPKPYTTPPGFVPPTLGEQFRYVSDSKMYGLLLVGGVCSWRWLAPVPRTLLPTPVIGTPPFARPT